jgi:hypothetical protein
VCTGELAECLPGLGGRHPGQARSGQHGDVGPGVQAEQPEHPGGSGVELLVGPGEHAADAGGWITCVQGVKPPLCIAELGCNSRQRELRPRGGTGGGDGQRQWQPGAQVSDLGDRAGVGGGALAAEPGRQHLAGLGRRQDIEDEQAGVLGGGQASELAAAGHEHEAAWRAGQQRANLLLIAGVVEQDQYLPAG